MYIFCNFVDSGLEKVGDYRERNLGNLGPVSRATQGTLPGMYGIP